MARPMDFDRYAIIVQELAAPHLAVARGAKDLAELMAVLTRRAEEDLAAGLSQQEGVHIACAAGCGSCCVVNVAVLFPEAAAIVWHLRRRQEDSLKWVARRVAGLYRQVSWLDDEERILLRRPCAFLDEAGSCSIYPVRPLLCRSITSTDPARCREAIAMEALGEAPPVLMNLFQKGLMNAAYRGVAAALADRGLDGRGTKLTVAVHRLLTDPQAVARYLAGGPVPAG
jgi:Fe-S-cluster containining protein